MASFFNNKKIGKNYNKFQTYLNNSIDADSQFDFLNDTKNLKQQPHLINSIRFNKNNNIEIKVKFNKKMDDDKERIIDDGAERTGVCYKIYLFLKNLY